MSKHFLILISFCALALAACRGTLEAGIERTPTPDAIAAQTIADLRAENELLKARLLLQPTPSAPVNLGRIAYVQGGDIWVKPLPDDKPQRLTSDGRNREPHWSPSGEWLMFRKETAVVIRQAIPCDEAFKPSNQKCFESISTLQKQLWVMRSDGNTARQVSHSSVEDAVWSPIDDRLAFVTTNGELQTMRADESNAATLVEADEDKHFIGRIAWKPDGTAIVYEYRVAGSAPPQGIWQVSLADKRQTEIFNGAQSNKGEVMLAGWLDNRQILFWQAETKTTPLVDGAPLYRLMVEPTGALENLPIKQSAEPMLAFNDFIARSPANNTLALVIGQGRNTWTNKRIGLPSLSTITDVAAISPAWSPGGAQLAYAAMPAFDDNGATEELSRLMQRRIRIVDFGNAATSRQLTTAAGYRDERPLWSADGKAIVFARIDPKGRASVWLVASLDGSPRQIIDELTPAPDPFGQYGHISWENWFDWWRG